MKYDSFQAGRPVFLFKIIRKPVVIGGLLLAIAAAQTASAWQPPTNPIAAATIDDVAEQTPAQDKRTQARPLSDVQVASFKQVVPGTSTVDQVIGYLGEPVGQETSEGQTSLVYKIAPFESVEIVAFDKIVESIVVYLAKPGELDQIASGLGLQSFVPAKITDVDGKLLGQAYPERGILLGFAPGDSGDGASRVAQIAIERIDPGSFLYRAKYNRGHHYRAAVQDLLSVQAFDPEDDESFALCAEILLLSGRYAEAAKQVDQALKLNANEPRYRLLNARLLSRQNKYVEAVTETKQVLATPDISELTKAEANHQLGNLLAIASVPNYKESLQHQTDVIRSTNALLDDESREVRIAARKLSLAAHLSIADNIARGPWKRHQEVSQRWIDRAEEIAKELVTSGDADEIVMWTLQRKKLSVLATAAAVIDPDPVVEELIRISKALVVACDDPWFRARVQMQTGEAMIFAAQLEHWRRDVNLAIEFATAGIKLMQEGAKERDFSPDDNYRLGRAYFTLGSTYAILKADHQSAVSWFEKAEPNLDQRMPEAYSYEKSLHGDRFISMGVSYWQIGKGQKAAELTKTGIGILEEAVKNGSAKAASLKIPYNNYGNMQKKLGNSEEAQRYIDRSAKLESEAGTRR